MATKKFADLLPDLSKEEFEALKADIKQRGVLVPVFVDEEGNILDGRHRLKIDPKAPRTVVTGLTDAEKEAFVFRSNNARRNLSQAQKKELLKRMKETAVRLKEQDKKHWTDKRIGEALGVARETVRDWFAKPKKTNTSIGGSANTCTPPTDPPDTYQPADPEPKAEPEPPRPDARTTIPKSHHEIIYNRYLKGESQSQIASDYKVSQQQISAIIAKEKKKHELVDESQSESDSVLENEDLGIILGDFRLNADIIKDESVDLIFTDPPYDRATIPQYEDLAKLAARVLCKGGSLICYVGHYAIPDILPLMTPHLTFHWVLCVLHTGGNKNFPGKNVMVAWKPLLWFTKGARWNSTQIRDCISSEKGEKDKYHEWAQGTVDAGYCIEHLTRKRGLVLDPFCGGASTGEAALRLGRKFVAFEINGSTVKKARGRIKRIQEEVNGQDG
jgi:16S rRNA G966 N2-methylase RsmD